MLRAGWRQFRNLSINEFVMPGIIAGQFEALPRDVSVLRASVKKHDCLLRLALFEPA